MISKSCGIIVNDKHTDIVINGYNNREFIIISQYKKLGSLVSVAKSYPLVDFERKQYDAKVIFGEDKEEIHAAARYIAEQINSDKPLLVSICLKDFEVSTLRTIVKAIKKLRS